MKKQHFLLPENFLGQAAFMLLSSSTLNRYIRVAKSLAQSSTIRRNLELNLITVQDLINHADYLWRLVLKSRQRDIPEVELATILPIIANFATDEASEFLMRLSILDQPPATWISALARQLLNHRPANQLIDHPKTSLVPFVVTSVGADHNSLENLAKSLPPCVSTSTRDSYSYKSVPA